MGRMTKKKARGKALWRAKKQIKAIGVPDSVAVVLAAAVVKHGMIYSQPRDMLGMWGTGLFNDDYSEYPQVKQDAAGYLGLDFSRYPHPFSLGEPCIYNGDGVLLSEDFEWIREEFPILN